MSVCPYVCMDIHLLVPRERETTCLCHVGQSMMKPEHTPDFSWP